MIDLRGITQIYPGPQGPVEALRGIDLHITPGEVFGIIGRSGAGTGCITRVTASCVPSSRRGWYLMPLLASTAVACANCSMVKVL